MSDSSNPELIIEIVPSRDGFKKAFKQGENEAKKSGQKIGENIEEGISSRKNPIDSISTKIAGLGPLAVAAGISIAAGLFSSEAIAASVRQEQAVSRTENSLRRIGQYSNQTSNELQAYASQIQAATRFGDEFILEQLAMAQGMGASVDQSKLAVSAATDLATALNMDLGSAVRNITKTLSGQKGELGELIPALRGLSAEQLKSGEGIKLISQLYQGFAKRDAQDFGAALDRNKNSLGDFLEGLGSFVTRSELAKDIVNGLNVALDYYAKKLNQASKVEPPTVEQLNSEINENIKQIEVLKNKLKTLPKYNDFQRKVMGYGGLEDQSAIIEKELEKLALKDIELQQKKLAVENGIKQQKAIKDKAARDKEIADEKEKNDKILANLAANGFSQLLTADEYYKQRTSALDDALKNNLLTESQYHRLSLQAQRDYESQKESEKIKSEIAPLDGEGFFSGFMASQSQFDATTKKTTKDLGRAWTAFGQTAKRGIGDGLGQGFAALGEALVTGENAFDAFTKAFLGSLGQMMIQQGTAFILQGLGFSVIPGLQASGGTLLAAGAGLTIAGGALTALSGGASKPTTTQAAADYSSSGSDISGADISSNDIEEREEVAPIFNLHMDGILTTDKESAAKMMVDVINDLKRDTGYGLA